MKIISRDRRNSIISLLNAGLSGEKLARRLSIFTSTVSKYRKQYANNNVLPKGGRPAVLTDAKKRQTKRHILSGFLKSAAEVHRFLVHEELELSHMTVNRALKSMGFLCKFKKKKPFLSARHKASRLKWAKEHSSWTVEDWRKVTFPMEPKSTFGAPMA